MRWTCASRSPRPRQPTTGRSRRARGRAAGGRRRRSGESMKSLDPAAYVQDDPDHEQRRPVADRRAAGGVGPSLGVARVAGGFGGERASGLTLPRFGRSSITAQNQRPPPGKPGGQRHRAATGFPCSGQDCSVPGCAKLAPAPVSEARIVLDIDREGSPTLCAMGQRQRWRHRAVGLRSGALAIEIHVQRSDITDAAAAGFVTFYSRGRPAKDVIDFGCVNPNPGRHLSRPGRVPARRLTSIGDRIFGIRATSKTYTPLGEIALQGPGAMMAQGNYSATSPRPTARATRLASATRRSGPETLKDELPAVRQISPTRASSCMSPGQPGPRASTPGSISRRSRARRTIGCPCQKAVKNWSHGFRLPPSPRLRRTSQPEECGKRGICPAVEPSG